MRMLARVLLCGFLMLWSTCGLSARTAGAAWKAGVAKANITPDQYMWMSGYAARDRPAEGKLTDLWAKALVLEDEAGQKLLILTLDLVGIDRDTLLRVRPKLTEKLGIPAERIALFTSHTHSGPVVRSNLKPMYALSAEHWALVEQYGDKLEASIVSASEQAAASLAPCELSWGVGRTTFAVNRRANREPDVPKLREAGMLQGPNDHEVPVLRVDVNGVVKAIVFGYACHATVLSGFEWSGDYPGEAQIELEQRFPEAIALFWAGCGADQNPVPRREVQLSKDYGRMLADAVEAIVNGGDRKVLSGESGAAAKEIPLGFAAIPTREQLEQAKASTNVYESRRAVYLLAKLDAEGAISTTYPYPVQVWKLGNGPVWPILGGEVVVDYSLRLKGELGEGTWVAGYANDVMAYIPSLRVLKEGGYEGGGAMVYYGLPSPWNESVEEDVVKAVHELAAQVKPQ